MELLAEDFAEPRRPRDRRAAAKIAVVQQRVPAAAKPARQLSRISPRCGTVRLRGLGPERSRFARVLDFFAPKAAEAKIEIDLLPRSRLAQRGARPRVVSRALINLVLNAQQAMPDGGQLVVRTEDGTAAAWSLELIDTGCGMDDEHRGAHVRGVLLDQARRLGPGPAHRAARSSKRTAAASACESEVGRGTQVHDRTAAAAAADGRDRAGMRADASRRCMSASRCFSEPLPCYSSVIMRSGMVNGRHASSANATMQRGAAADRRFACSSSTTTRPTRRPWPRACERVGYDCTVATSGPQGIKRDRRRHVRHRDHRPDDERRRRARRFWPTPRKCCPTPR